MTRAIVENAIRKLEKILEPECSQFVAATKAGFLAGRDNSIRQRLAAAKAQEHVLQGHDLSGKERFHPETRHMITLEVQNDKSPDSRNGEKGRKTESWKTPL